MSVMYINKVLGFLLTQVVVVFSLRTSLIMGKKREDGFVGS